MASVPRVCQGVGGGPGGRARAVAMARSSRYLAEAGPEEQSTDTSLTAAANGTPDKLALGASPLITISSTGEGTPRGKSSEHT